MALESEAGGVVDASTTVRVRGGRAWEAGLMDGITLPYIGAGVVGWWRRPGSGFGREVGGAGFAMFVWTVAWTNADGAPTIGQAFDLVPTVVFVHVFLAFPGGRLESRF